MGTFEVVAFDFDGVVVDSQRGIVVCLQESFESHRLGVPSAESISTVIGPPLEIGVRDLLLHDGAEPELAPAVVSDFRDRYRLRSCELTEKFDGVVDVLSSIRSKGVVTAIATSKPRDLTVQLLEHLGLTDLFDRVECQATVGWDSKTMVLRRLIEQIGTRPEMVVMVGDRSHDMEASAEVGARSVGVLWGYGSADELTSAGAEFLVASPPELLELLAADL